MQGQIHPFGSPEWLKSKGIRYGNLKAGVQAPDDTVVKIDGSTTNLLSYQQGERPLVLNFGSFS